jgi:glycosyltransferase involved in cell wall biosynthesis
LHTKKEILILVDWFAPGYKAGGPIQSCVNVSFALKNDYRIFVFTTDTDYGASTPYEGIATDTWIQNLDPAINVFYARKKLLSLQQVKKVITAADADYIYLNHLFSPLFVVYPLWLKWKGVIKSKVVVCPRGALYESALSIKRYKKTPFLKLLRWMGIHKMIRFHATNEREKSAILHYFPGSEVLIADNLPKSGQEVFCDATKNKAELKCIFVSRIHPIKNLHFLLQALQQVKAQIALTIVGPVEDAKYWEECKTMIDTLPENCKVVYKGALPNHALPEIIQEHHLFILPTTGENFGHAIFESFLAGRPVLISDQTPWQKLSAAGVGWDLPLGDAAAFSTAIETAASWDQQAFTSHATAAWNYAAAFISNPLLKQQYLQLFS